MRKRGTGTVAPAPGGHWDARLPGRYGRKRIGRFESEEAAQRALRASLEVLAHEPDLAVLTVDGWGQQWLDRRDASEDYGSVRKERTRWDCRIGDTDLGCLPLEDLDPIEVRAWLDGIRLLDGSEPSFSVRRGCLSLLRSAMKAAVDGGLLYSDPTAGVRLPRGAAKGSGDRWAWLRADEVEHIIAAMRANTTTRLRPPRPGFSLQWQAIITVAIYSGLRAAELHALPWRCVDLEAGLLRVEQTRDQPEGIGADRTVSPSTKSGHAREVPLMAPAVAVLREWRAEYQRRGLRSHHDLVWPAADGGPRSEGYDAQLPRALDLAGVNRKIRFHDLRHTCASHLVQGTWAPDLVTEPLRLEEVRQWLGHGSIAMVQRYAHMDPKGLRRLAVLTTPAPPIGPPTVHKGAVAPAFLAVGNGFLNRRSEVRILPGAPHFGPRWTDCGPIDDAVAAFVAAVESRDPHVIARGLDLVQAWHDLRAELGEELERAVAD